MSDLTRREAVHLLAGAIGTLGLTPPLIERAWKQVRTQSPYPADRRFFTDAEWQTVRLLVDYIIPRDERSGSATDAQVPEFMDFVLAESTSAQIPIRGGLAWLDTECRERFGARFADAPDARRRELLDLIAWPAKAPASLSHGVEFFNRFRDLTASGFWSSRIGVEDLQYLGNTFMAEWNGCPDEAVQRLLG